ncbi:MAG: hypothetical protein NVS3B26_24190 [Mycobacteriales bacterium]
MATQPEPHVNERQQVQTVEAALQRRFAGKVPADAISTAISQELAEFDEAPVRTFVPLLVHKQVRERLRHTPSP